MHLFLITTHALLSIVPDQSSLAFQRGWKKKSVVSFYYLRGDSKWMLAVLIWLQCLCN